jgi:hypothetical protein
MVSWLYGEGEQNIRANSHRAHGEPNDLIEIWRGWVGSPPLRSPPPYPGRRALSR